MSTEVTDPTPARGRRWLRRILFGVALLFVLIQLVPYGRDHSNPPVLKEPAWDTPRTRELARRACFDCHSNEVVWPWYSHVAPISWLVQRDVDEGRAELNFSEWNKPQEEAHEAAKIVREGEMPPWFYLPTHPEARLTAAETEALAKGLAATIGKDKRGKHGKHDDDD